MKKWIFVFLTALLLCFAQIALAANVAPGETITMYVSITATNGEGAARVHINTNGAPVTFVSASDSHSLAGYATVGERLPAIVEALGLTEDDRYIVPKK